MGLEEKALDKINPSDEMESFFTGVYVRKGICSLILTHTQAGWMGLSRLQFWSLGSVLRVRGNISKNILFLCYFLLAIFCYAFNASV
ncbi:MAG: hypothetical protein ACI8ZB_001613 [Desulforhopalus sp.]